MILLLLYTQYKSVIYLWACIKSKSRGQKHNVFMFFKFNEKNYFFFNHFSPEMGVQYT